MLYCVCFRAQEERERLAATRGAPTIDRDLAATQIQKVIAFWCAIMSIDAFIQIFCGYYSG